MSETEEHEEVKNFFKKYQLVNAGKLNADSNHFVVKIKKRNTNDKALLFYSLDENNSVIGDLGGL